MQKKICSSFGNVQYHLKSRMSNFGAQSKQLSPHFYPYSQTDPEAILQDPRTLGKCSLKIADLVHPHFISNSKMGGIGYDRKESSGINVSPGSSPCQVHDLEQIS